MGRAMRWICRIFCKDKKAKQIKSSTKFRRSEIAIEKNAVPAIGEESASRSSYDGFTDAVAAASSMAAEAAFVAAQAAVQVVRLTRSGRLEFDLASRAAVVIQSSFRAYLARKALKALVKLQALVRGNIVRKQAVDHMRRMHALLKAQAYARAVRAPVPASSYSSTHTTHSSMLDTSTSESPEYARQARISRNDYNNSPWCDTRSVRSNSARRRYVDYAESNHSGTYRDIPNYMAYTKSSEAKSRSVSAPKQRTQLDTSSSTKSNSTRDLGRRISPWRIQ